MSLKPSCHASHNPMCGFVAIFDLKKNVKDQASELQSMSRLISHRGPDHEGFYSDDYAAFGHRRLSIIDLSGQANQPMESDDCVLVYNGEIYNYLEIKHELVARHQVEFATTSDTEVLIKAYRAWGENCVKKFNGMFAFVLWDKKNRKLFAARDRLGVKPLFIKKRGDGRSYFASDIKSLWKIFPPGDDLDINSINSYLIRGYLSRDKTPSKSIKKFPQAHTLSIDDKGEHLRSYWDLNEVQNSTLNFSEALEKTETILRDAVSIRLRSDVPVGAFLSGGIDSSLITALTTGDYRQIDTFSIGMNVGKFDESKYAIEVAKKTGTQHHHLNLDSSCLEELPEIVWMFSDLFGDDSALPTYFLARFASQKLKVVLTGDGGDEAFGGYVGPFSAYLLSSYRKIPEIFRKQLGGTASGLERISSDYRIRWFSKFNRLSLMEEQAALVSQFIGEGWLPYASSFHHADSSEIQDSLYYSKRCHRDNTADKILFSDIQDRLVHDYLVKVDRATMAHSLEARSPLLDYRLMELGYSLKNSVRFKGFKRKAILKKLSEPYFSKNFIYRKKMGFSLPLADWMLEKKWWHIISNMLKRSRCLPLYMNMDAVNAVLEEFRTGRKFHSHRIWILTWLHLWHEIFIAGTLDPKQKLSQL